MAGILSIVLIFVGTVLGMAFKKDASAVNGVGWTEVCHVRDIH